jgi:hypothetical protein
LSFELVWAKEAKAQFDALHDAAQAAAPTRSKSKTKKTKSSRQAGLFKQVAKTIGLLLANPRHPSLNTHEYSSLQNPYGPDGKVFEAYAQNKTPGAYRVFWCYGAETGQINILAITPHP